MHPLDMLISLVLPSNALIIVPNANSLPPTAQDVKEFIIIMIIMEQANA